MLDKQTIMISISGVKYIERYGQDPYIGEHKIYIVDHQKNACVLDMIGYAWIQSSWTEAWDKLGPLTLSAGNREVYHLDPVEAHTVFGEFVIVDGDMFATVNDKDFDLKELFKKTIDTLSSKDGFVECRIDVIPRVQNRSKGRYLIVGVSWSWCVQPKPPLEFPV